MKFITQKAVLTAIVLLYGTIANAECIGLVTAGGGHAYWEQVERGANQAVKELGVTLHTRGAVDSANEQAQHVLIDKFINREGCRGLVLAANSVDKKKVVAQLKAQGVPTVYIDRDIGGERISVIKTNSFSAGELAGEEMAKALKGRGKVAVFRERENREPTTARENGFIKAANKGGLEVVVDVVVGSMVGQVRINVFDILQNTTNLDGIFTPNESTTTGTLATLKRVKLAGKIIHIGFDSNEYIVKSVQYDQLYGFILQSPYEIGYQGVHTVYRAMKGQSIKTDIETGVVFVDRDNINTTKIKKKLGLDQ